MAYMIRTAGKPKIRAYMHFIVRFQTAVISMIQ